MPSRTQGEACKGECSVGTRALLTGTPVLLAWSSGITHLAPLYTSCSSPPAVAAPCGMPCVPHSLSPHPRTTSPEQATAGLAGLQRCSWAGAVSRMLGGGGWWGSLAHSAGVGGGRGERNEGRRLLQGRLAWQSQNEEAAPSGNSCSGTPSLS
jgi:hypothetical protein